MQLHTTVQRDNNKGCLSVTEVACRIIKSRGRGVIETMEGERFYVSVCTLRSLGDVFFWKVAGLERQQLLLGYAQCHWQANLSSRHQRGEGAAEHAAWWPTRNSSTAPCVWEWSHTTPHCISLIRGKERWGENDKCESSRHATAGDTLRDSSHRPWSAALYSSRPDCETQTHTMRGWWHCTCILTDNSPKSRCQVWYTGCCISLIL